MRAGALNRQVRIDRNGGVKDDLGQPIPGWTPLALPVWADIKVISGKKAVEADSDVGSAAASIRIRYRTDVTTGMLAVVINYVDRQPVDGHVFQILEALPDFAGREYTDLVCSTETTGG